MVFISQEYHLDLRRGIQGQGYRIVGLQSEAIEISTL